MSNVNARILLWGIEGSGKTTTLADDPREAADPICVAISEPSPPDSTPV